MITDDVRDIIEQAKLAFVATTSPDGSPKLSPKASRRVYDDELVPPGGQAYEWLNE